MLNVDDLEPFYKAVCPQCHNHGTCDSVNVVCLPLLEAALDHKQPEVVNHPNELIVKNIRYYIEDKFDLVQVG